MAWRLFRREWRQQAPVLTLLIVAIAVHQKIAIPGSVATVDLRAEDPHGPYGQPMLRVDAGRYPSAPNEVAVTRRVARLFNLHVGGSWQADATTRRVVGIVEDPNDLHDTVALVAPGQANQPSSVDILLNTTEARIQASGCPATDPSNCRRADRSSKAVRRSPSWS